MDAQTERRQYVERLEHALRAQIAEMDKLRTENQRLLDWILGSADAHTCLQAVYNDPNASEANRVKAAAASLPFEKPKLTSVPPCLELRAESIPLKELLASRKARAERFNGLGSTEPPIEVLSIADGRYRKGNGNDSASNGSDDSDH
jgi:hypothetical protein